MIVTPDCSTILELRAELFAGTTTVRQCVADALRRAHALQPELQAFCHLPAVIAANDAPLDAPLAGVAVAVKDIIDTAEMPTEFNSPAYRGRQPRVDAPIVQKLRAAGATILGKTVTTEFAWRQPGPTVNPWNPAHSPGGSSSGSAAAVAAGIVPLALGTQTMGSVIRPAAYCGVVGFKPSYGLIDKTGVLPLASSLDHVGLFTRCVADVGYVMRAIGAIGGAAHATCAGAMPRAPRIGLLARQPGGEIEAEQQAVLDALAARLRANGADIVDFDWPASFADALGCASTLLAVEAALTHRELVDRAPAQVSAPMIALVAEGRATAAVDYAHARARQTVLAQSFTVWLRDVLRLDALLVAPASGVAPHGLAYTGDASFCAPWTFLGAPALTVPAGFGVGGLPLGAQLVGVRERDAALLTLGEWVEHHTGWSRGASSR